MTLHSYLQWMQDESPSGYVVTLPQDKLFISMEIFFNELVRDGGAGPISYVALHTLSKLMGFTFLTL